MTGQDGLSRAAIYSSGTVTDLKFIVVLPAQDLDSGATGINNNGDVVVSSTTASGIGYGSLYTCGALTTLAPLIFSPRDINDNGSIIGQYSATENVAFSLLWSYTAYAQPRFISSECYVIYYQGVLQIGLI